MASRRQHQTFAGVVRAIPAMAWCGLRQKLLPMKSALVEEAPAPVETEQDLRERIKPFKGEGEMPIYPHPFVEQQRARAAALAEKQQADALERVVAALAKLKSDFGIFRLGGLKLPMLLTAEVSHASEAAVLAHPDFCALQEQAQKDGWLLQATMTTAFNGTAITLYWKSSVVERPTVRLVHSTKLVDEEVIPSKPERAIRSGGR